MKHFSSMFLQKFNYNGKSQKSEAFDKVKKVFFKYDGSLFAMAREEQEVYENFKMLNVSEETVEKWRQEIVLNLWEQLKISGSSDLFNRMYDILDNKHNRENLLILKEALYKVNYINPEVNACISETVIGRKVLSVRSGMIFWAYDLGEQEIAKELLHFVWGLVSLQTSDERIKGRLERIKENCYLISSQINYLNFPN